MAVEPYIEYRFFDHTDADSIEDAENIDSEYFSDRQAFERLLIDSPIVRRDGFDLQIGSISSKRFLNRQIVELRRPMTKQLEFHLLWLQDEDFESEYRNFLLELAHSLGHRFSLSVIGSPGFEKSQIDVGLALDYHVQSERNFRLFVNFPDFQRNKRTLESDRFVSGYQPLSAGLVFRSPSWEVAYRYDKPTIWQIPASQVEYRFHRSTAQFQFRSRAGVANQLAALAYYENQEEGQYPLLGSTSSARILRRSRTDFRTEWRRALETGEFTFGLGYFDRRYREISTETRTSTVLPITWWALPFQEYHSFEARWKWGIDATRFEEAMGPVNLHSRLNTVYEVHSVLNQWSLDLLMSVDLDRRRGDALWEGGAGQFQMEF